jgi:hypothetical protein
MTRFVVRIFIAFVIFALLIGGAVALYNAGFTQGAALTGKIIAPNSANAAPVTPYYNAAPVYYHPWGFFPFNCIFPLLGLFILFAILRRMFFWGRYSHHRDDRQDDPRYQGGWGRHGRRGRWGWDGEQAPPFVNEMHRKMHENMKEDGPDQDTRLS